jgi:hypothetical protein
VTEDSSGSTPTPTEVIAALSHTGFLLEHQVSQFLREYHYDTEINYAYPDPDSGKSREVDVRAYLEHFIQRQPAAVFLMAELIIECKNSPNPFVLVGERGHHKFYRNESVFISFDPLGLKFPNCKPGESVDDVLRLQHLPGSISKDDFIGYQLVRMHRQSGNWRADNSSIYDSILYPLAKAWQYSILQRQDDEEVDEVPLWNSPFIEFIFPIIVTAGPVYAVNVGDDGPEVNQVRWATLQRTFRSSDVSGEFRADVVSFAHLREYLESRVVRIVEGARTVITANIHLYDPEWLFANRGNPEDKETFDAWVNEVRSKRNVSLTSSTSASSASAKADAGHSYRVQPRPRLNPGRPCLSGPSGLPGFVFTSVDVLATTQR